MGLRICALAILVLFSLYTGWTMLIAEQSLLAFGLALLAQPDTAQVLIDLYLMAGLVALIGIGINGTDVRHAAAGLERAGGVLVASVDPEGPAAQAGLARGDLITAINGQRIDSLGHALDLVAESAPHSTLPMRIQRQGKNLQLDITIGELAPYSGPQIREE